MGDFVPQRWRTSAPRVAEAEEEADVENLDGLQNVSFESNATGSLFAPIKGSYLPFAEGPRSCPGKRFAQVEMTAVLASIYQEYTVELDVGKWASDAEVAEMSKSERKVVYEKAIVATQKIIDDSVVVIALKMMTAVPLRLVKRGEERFMDSYV